MIGRGGIKDIFLATVFSVLASVLLVFVFALIVKWVQIDSTGISIGNTVIRLLSVFLGIIIGFKTHEKGAIKGAISGMLYAVLSSITFSLYAGGGVFDALSLTSVIFGLISGAISGIIAVNIRK